MVYFSWWPTLKTTNANYKDCFSSYIKSKLRGAIKYLNFLGISFKHKALCQIYNVVFVNGKLEENLVNELAW